MDLTTICRTCLDGNSKYYQIYDYVDDSLRIIEMLDEIVPQIDIKKEESDLMSPLICENCVETLATCYKFQQLCIDADSQLRQLLSSQVVVVEEEDVLQPGSHFEEHEHVVEEEDDNIDMKIEIEYDFDRENVTNENIGHVETRTEEPTIPKDEEVETPRPTVERENYNFASKKRHTCTDCGKKFDRISRLKTHRCAHSKRRLYTCNICDCKFVNEKIYISHKQRHHDNEICFQSSNNNGNLLAENEKELGDSAAENEKELEENITELIKDEAKVDEDDAEFNAEDFDMEIFEDDDGEHDNDNDNDNNAENDNDDYNDNDDDNDNYDDNDMNDEGDWDGKNDNDIKNAAARHKSDHGPNNNIIGGIEKTDIKNRRSHRFPCEVCGKVYDRISRLQRHSRVHSLHKPYECEICKVRFSTPNYLKTHLLLHTKKDGDNSSKAPAEGFQCPDCPRRFEKMTALSGHRRKHKKKTLGEKQKCPKCRGEFMSVKTLVEHIRNKHPNAKKYPCDQCDKVFVLPALQLQHISRHNEKDLVCRECQKEFAFESMLKEHMRTHSGESPFLCPECGRQFKCGGNLRQHLERHSTERKYKCPECPMKFKCKIDVKKHAETHLGFKRHECEICGLRFSRAYGMEQHKLLHFAKPHKCEFCAMTFTSAALLRRHMRAHADTDEVMY